jgi:hypothetical protein
MNNKLDKMIKCFDYGINELNKLNKNLKEFHKSILERRKVSWKN